jgi:hypothetical protein
MKKALAALLMIATPLVFAHSCPAVMKEIDAKMSSAKDVSPDKIAKVKQLRADGERFHKEGKHDESMKALNEARSMLGS